MTRIIPNTSLQGESVWGSKASFKAVWERPLPLPCVHLGLQLAHLCRRHPPSLQNSVRWWEALTSWATTFIFPGIPEPSGTPQACLSHSGHWQTALQLQSTSSLSYGVSVAACENSCRQYIREWARLCSNKALLTKTGSGLDLASRLQFAHP